MAPSMDMRRVRYFLDSRSSDPSEPPRSSIPDSSSLSLESSVVDEVAMEDCRKEKDDIIGF